MSSKTMSSVGYVPLPSAFESTLLYMSETNSHINIRDSTTKDILAYLWVDEVLDDIPSQWSSVKFKMLWHSGSPESDYLIVNQLTEFALQFQGTWEKSNQPFTLRCKSSTKPHVWFEGVLKSSQQVFNIDILEKDTESNNLIYIPFMYKDPRVQKASRIIYQNELWSFVSWNGPNACKLLRNGKYAYPTVNKCLTNRPFSRLHYAGAKQVSTKLAATFAESFASASLLASSSPDSQDSSAPAPTISNAPGNATASTLGHSQAASSGPLSSLPGKSHDHILQDLERRQKDLEEQLRVVMLQIELRKLTLTGTATADNDWNGDCDGRKNILPHPQIQ